MKKTIILLLILLFLVTGFSMADKEKVKKDEKQLSLTDVVTKTYILKHIVPLTVDQTLRSYVLRTSYGRTSKMITVTMKKENVAKFEEFLEKLDVEPRKILLRIFTVIASKEGKNEEIKNKDLRMVLMELQKILSFNAFHLDGVSAITLTENQRRSKLRLSSHNNLELELEDISIRGENKGKRSVGFEFALRKFTEKVPPKDGQSWISETLIASETSIKENGYLVAGVSKIDNGDSLVLVINAEIK